MGHTLWYIVWVWRRGTIAFNCGVRPCNGGTINFSLKTTIRLFSYFNLFPWSCCGAGFPAEMRWYVTYHYCTIIIRWRCEDDNLMSNPQKACINYHVVCSITIKLFTSLKLMLRCHGQYTHDNIYWLLVGLGIIIVRMISLLCYCFVTVCFINYDWQRQKWQIWLYFRLFGDKGQKGCWPVSQFYPRRKFYLILTVYNLCYGIHKYIGNVPTL